MHLPTTDAVQIGSPRGGTGRHHPIDRKAPAMGDDMDRYWMPPTGSSNSSAAKKPPNVTSLDRAGHDHSRKSWDGMNRPSWIAALARQILSCYRRDDFADPENYLIQLGMILERYPDDIIREVTSPVTGIQRTCKFPPSIAEVVEFCDNAAGRAERIKHLSQLKFAPRAPRPKCHRANDFMP